MHFDGTFKTKRLSDGTVLPNPPRFQMFQCIEAPPPFTVTQDSPSDLGGRTLFVNTSNIYAESLAKSRYAGDVSNQKWTVFTPMNKSFGGDEMKIPILRKNSLTDHPVLSWHEPW